MAKYRPFHMYINILTIEQSLNRYTKYRTESKTVSIKYCNALFMSTVVIKIDSLFLPLV